MGRVVLIYVSKDVRPFRLRCILQNAIHISFILHLANTRLNQLMKSYVRSLVYIDGEVGILVVGSQSNVLLAPCLHELALGRSKPGDILLTLALNQPAPYVSPVNKTLESLIGSKLMNQQALPQYLFHYLPLVLCFVSFGKLEFRYLGILSGQILQNLH